MATATAKKKEVFDPTNKVQVKDVSARGKPNTGGERLVAIHPNDTMFFGKNKYSLIIHKPKGGIIGEQKRSYDTVEKLHGEIRGYVTRERREMAKIKQMLMSELDSLKKYSEPPEEEIKELNDKLKDAKSRSIYAFKHKVSAMLRGGFDDYSTDPRAVRAVPDEVEVQMFASVADIEELNKGIKPRKCRNFTEWDGDDLPMVFEKWVIIE